ncbi:MAG: acyltransferase family protein [Pseudomonadota bacterium]
MRNPTIDRLRTLMMCLVMVGHAMLPYVTVPRRFNDPAAHVIFDSIGILLYAFAMPAFFVTAGFSAAALLANKGVRAFWHNRLVRIGLPLIIGYLILTPLTRAAYQFASAASTDGLAAGFAAISTLDWLRYSKLYHLWFLATLILFSGLTQVTLIIWQRLPRSRHEKAQQYLDGNTGQPWLFWVLIVVAAVPSALSYVSGTGQGTDGWIQVMLWLFFASGWWLQGAPNILAKLNIGQLRYWLTLLIAVPVCVVSTRQRLFAEDQTDLISGLLAGVSSAAIGVCATALLLAAFRNEQNKQRPFVDYLSAASYWVYLVHYPIIVFVGGLVSVLAWSAGWKYLATLTIAVPIVLGSFEAVRRWQRGRRRQSRTA